MLRHPGLRWRAPLTALLAVQPASGFLTAPLLSQPPVYVDLLHFPPLFTASPRSAQMLLGAVASILGGLLLQSHWTPARPLADGEART